MAPLRLGLLVVTAAATMCALGVAGTAATPPDVAWVQGYGFQDTSGASESHPHAGVELADGGFLVVGDGVDYHNTSIVQRRIMVLRTDANGTQVWQRTFGTVGYNYGKFGIQLQDGSVLVAGATSELDKQRNYPVLKRTLIRLALEDGAEIQRIVLPNTGADTRLRDGFMCVVEDAAAGTLVATGFVGGENATTGYVDEPMFLIGGGRVGVTVLTYGQHVGTLTVVADGVIDDADLGFRAMQGMRVVFNAPAATYAISHTTSVDGGSTFEFGLSLLHLDAAGQPKILWTRSYPAGATAGLTGHASHPYALTQGADGTIVIGGLAVIFDSNHVEQCQGRIFGVNSSDGAPSFDKRFTSTEADTNIECYGIDTTPDSGYILTCGTGVEPELHPKDTPRQKTWRVLVHATNADGERLWQNIYTSNAKLQNNAGEYIVRVRGGGYAVYVDSQTYGPMSTGGNFAIMRLA